VNDILIAGDTLDFTDVVPDYPATAGWTLKYRLVPRFTTPVQAPITLTATASGADYVIAAAPTVTATWAAGAYSFFRWVEKAGARQTLDPAEGGQLTVKADPSAVPQGTDTRTQEEIALDAIDAVLANRATVDQKSYSIAGRSLERMAVSELLELRRYYAARVQKNKGLTGRIYLRA
jgi:hypothetical protein